jgi:hypothetical protein
MAVGRDFLPPEDADSWSEYHARLELEAAAGGASWLRPLCWAIAGALFSVGLICCAYGFQDHSLWLWLCMFASFGVLGVMAARAVDRVDREKARAVELLRLRDAWDEHLERHSPTR